MTVAAPKESLQVPNPVTLCVTVMLPGYRYTENIPRGKLGVGIMNRADITDDGYIARFHALEKSGADWLNLWVMPVHDVWLPFLQRWKTHCRGCPNSGALSCYEPSAVCSFPAHNESP